MILIKKMFLGGREDDLSFQGVIARIDYSLFLADTDHGEEMGEFPKTVRKSMIKEC